MKRSLFKEKGFALVFVLGTFLLLSSVSYVILGVIYNDYRTMNDLFVISDDTNMIKRTLYEFECLYKDDQIEDFYNGEAFVEVYFLNDEEYLLKVEDLAISVKCAEGEIKSWSIRADETKKGVGSKIWGSKKGRIHSDYSK